jgi:hypothetical protein
MRSGIFLFLFIWLSPSGWEACGKEDAHGAPKGDIGSLVSDNVPYKFKHVLKTHNNSQSRT